MAFASAEQEIATTGLECIDCIRDEVDEYLTNLSFKTEDVTRGAEPAANGDVAVNDAAVLEREDTVDRLLRIERSGV